MEGSLITTCRGILRKTIDEEIKNVLDVNYSSLRIPGVI